MGGVAHRLRGVLPTPTGVIAHFLEALPPRECGVIWIRGLDKTKLKWTLVITAYGLKRLYWKVSNSF